MIDLNCDNKSPHESHGWTGTNQGRSFDLNCKGVSGGDKPCPTCGAVRFEVCRRGRKPNGGAGIFGGEWRKGVPFPEGHDSRHSVNEKPERPDVSEVMVTTRWR